MYIEQGTALRPLSQEQGTVLRSLSPVCYAPHATQLWLKPMTQEHTPASQTSVPVHTLEDKSDPDT